MAGNSKRRPYTKSSTKSSAKKTRKATKRKRISCTDFLLLRVLLPLFIVYALVVCPRDKGLDHSVCYGLAQYRMKLLDPLVVGPIGKALNHPTLQPYIIAATPYKQRVWDNFILPQYRRRVVPAYYNHVVPRIEIVYEDTIKPLYERNIKPVYQQNIRPIYQRIQPVYERITPACNQVKSLTIHTWDLSVEVYHRAQPFVKQAGVWRAAYVDGHVRRIWEKVMELSRGDETTEKLKEAEADRTPDNVEEATPVIKDVPVVIPSTEEIPVVDNIGVPLERGTVEAVSTPAASLSLPYPATSSDDAIASEKPLTVEIRHSDESPQNSSVPSTIPSSTIESTIEHASPAISQDPIVTSESLTLSTSISSEKSSSVKASSGGPTASSSYAEPTTSEDVNEEPSSENVAPTSTIDDVLIATATVGEYPTAEDIVEEETVPEIESPESALPPDTAPAVEQIDIVQEDESISSSNTATVAEEGIVVADIQTSIAAATDATSEEEEEEESNDLDSFLFDLGLPSLSPINSTQPHALNSTEEKEEEEEEFLPPSEQPIAQPARPPQTPEELQAQKERQTASKRAAIKAREAAWIDEMEKLVDEKKVEARLTLEVVRGAMVHALEDSNDTAYEGLNEKEYDRIVFVPRKSDTEEKRKVGTLLGQLQDEGERLLKGLEIFLRREKKDVRLLSLGSEDFDFGKRRLKWEAVLEKVEGRFGEVVQDVQESVLAWFKEGTEVEIENCLAISAQVQTLAGRAQADLGIDYIWLEDVTYDDWQGYHDFMRVYEAFDTTVRTLQNGTHPNAPENPVPAALAELQEGLQDVIAGWGAKVRGFEGMARKIYKVAQEEPEVHNEVSEAIKSEDEEALEDVVIGKDAMVVEEALAHVEDVSDESEAVKSEEQDTLPPTLDVAPEYIVIGKDAKVVEEELAGLHVEL